MGSNQRSSRKKAVQIGRRSFLATTATLAGTSVTVVEASDEAVDRFSLGKRGFIETSVTHKGAPDYPRSQGHRYVADYIIEDSLLSLINFPIETIKNNKTIVTTGKKYNKLGSVDFDSPSQKSLIIDRDYRYLEETTLTLEDEYSTPTVVTKERDDGKIRFEVDDQVIDVSPGEERKIEISDQKINVLERNENGDTKVVRESVTPILNVFNHGLVDIYGSRNNAIVPADTRDPFGRSIVDYFEKASNLNIPDGPSFVVIPNEVLK